MSTTFVWDSTAPASTSTSLPLEGLNSLYDEQAKEFTNWRSDPSSGVFKGIHNPGLEIRFPIFIIFAYLLFCYSSSEISIIHSCSSKLRCVVTRPHSHLMKSFWNSVSVIPGRTCESSRLSSSESVGRRVVEERLPAGAGRSTISATPTSVVFVVS